MALQSARACRLGQRSSYIFRQRFNLSTAAILEGDAPDVPATAPAAPPGGPFAVAWRNYIRAVFVKGHMYKISCNPSAILYIAENKTLAGREQREHDEEALGRKMAVVFYENLPGGLAQRVHRETLGMQQNLLTIAELLQTLGGFVLPADPARTAADTELLLERKYMDLGITRFNVTVEPEAPEVHVYRMDDENDAEAALLAETPAAKRTKMMLARALARNEKLLDGEDLRKAFDKTLVTLRGRAMHLWAAPAPAAPAPRGRGKGRGKG